MNELRQEYVHGVLSEKDLPKNPRDLFARWWQDAIDAKDPMLDAVFLATAGPDANGRIVLLKYFNDHGFYFFTNYESAKAQDLKHNHSACMVFFWPTLERQIRIKGDCLKVSEEESAQYFSQRPRGSQLSAWSSPQSQVVAGRDILESQVKKFEQKFLNQEIPCPPHWGGFCLKPKYFEFWQGRKDRLHDRFCYKPENNGFSIERLAP